MATFSRWRTILATVVVACGVVMLSGGVFIYLGPYLAEWHRPLTSWIFETIKVRSIKAHAAGIQVPAGLGDEANIAMGVGQFAAHCAVCHGAPGVPKSDLAHGLNPEPPDLTVNANLYNDAELFWIIKHGIKMTGMPSWADQGDDALWATVALLKKLPTMTPEEYAKLVMAAWRIEIWRRSGGAAKGTGR